MKILIGIIILVLLIIVTITAISKTSKSNSNAARNYLLKLDETPPTFQVNDVKIKFGELFEDFKLGATKEIIKKTYAEDFYFNDTFKVLSKRNELIPYMIETAGHVKSTTVEILDVAKSDTDYYVRWIMIMEFEAKSKNIYSRSVGMTQLRFNSQGKIIFHQDFWDSTEGFYQHLPYIGYFIRKIRSKL